MSARADDGTPLEIKEGVILDGQGRPLTHKVSESLNFKKTRGFTLVSSGGLPLIVGLGIFIPLLVVAGFAIAAVAGILLSVFVLNKTVGRLFRAPR